jgi:predicted aspartyl protease
VGVRASLALRSLAALMLCLAGAGAAQRRPVPTAPTRVAPLPPAVIDDALTIGGEDIDGRKVRTRMTVGVQVNGHGPYRFVVDSGADTSVIGMNLAKALAMPPSTPVTLHGVTGSAVVERVRVDSLGLGQSVREDMELPVLLERDIGGAGMVGIDALVEQRLMLDFEQRVIKIEDAVRPAPRLDGEIVVVARRRRGQLILTQARVNGKQVEAVVDTGSELTIGNNLLRAQLQRRYGDRFSRIEVIGVTGAVMALDMIRVAELKLGPVELQNVEIAFADIPPFTVFGMTDRPALLLGTDLMETFRRVSLDFRARKVRFQLRRCAAQGITVSTSADAVSRLRLASGGEAACRR